MVSKDTEMFNVVVQHYVLDRGMTLEDATKLATKVKRKGWLAKAYNLIQR